MALFSLVWGTLVIANLAPCNFAEQMILQGQILRIRLNKGLIVVPILPSLPSPEEKEEAQLPLEEKEEAQLPPEEKEEAQLPPEAQGDVNGGPLGCCLGTTIGLLLSISIALLSRFYASPLAHLLGSAGVLGIVTRILMIVVAIVAVFICSYFGWRIGKSVFREYDPPVVPERGKRKHSY